MTSTTRNNGQTTRRRVVTTLATAAAIAVGLGSPAGAEPQGYIAVPLGVGYFYGTFDQSPNLQLLVGGTAEEFCADNPGDPFFAEPGSAPGRIYLRSDGVDVKANDKDQPIHMYSTELADGPAWIAQVCDGSIEPELFASGTADLKVRVRDAGDVVDVFNSVNGTATGTDGTQYKVRAWADLVVENGVPVGDPADFVGLELHEIGG